MKTIFALFTLIALALTASAQTPGVYSIYRTNALALNGGTNNVGTAATNTYAAVATSEYDNFGVQFTFKGQASGTSTVQIMGYKSLDSTTYETSPSVNFLVTLNGTTDVSVCTNVPVASAAVWKFQIGNTNAAVAVTNIAGKVRYNAPIRTLRN